MFWLWQLSSTICTSLCSSRDSVKNFASAANGSGTSGASASRLNVGHCGTGTHGQGTGGIPQHELGPKKLGKGESIAHRDGITALRGTVARSCAARLGTELGRPQKPHAQKSGGSKRV